MKDTIIKKTAKRKQEVSLPANPDIVYIPNRVTNARYNYSVIQEKIFNYVLVNLQEAIKLSMNGGNYQQLELFKDINEDRISITIPIRNIAEPNHYPEVREAAENLAKSIIRIIQVNKDTGHKEMRSLTLFGAIVTPIDKVRNSDLKIEITKEVARLLVEMDSNKMGMPSNYTSFLLQVATQAKNKYTSRIYKKISSWKEKGGFYQTLEEFRDWLELGEKYKTFFDIKKNILIPVQKELQGKADCWFNCAEKTFEKREGKKVVGLNWKVITPQFEEAVKIKAENFKSMLRVHAHLKDEDIKQLEPFLSTDFDLSRFTLRLIEIRDYIAANKVKIDNPKAYLIQALLNDFAKTKKT